jgi:hypothetical protein
VLVRNAILWRQKSTTLASLGTLLALIAPCWPAYATGYGGCTARLVDDECQPHSGVYDEGDTMRVATVCELTTEAGKPSPKRIYEPSPAELERMLLERSGCKYPVEVQLRKTDEHCGAAVVYEVELEEPGRYTFFRQRLTVGEPDLEGQPGSDESFGGLPDDGFGGACPEPPAEIVAQLQAKREAERMQREIAALPPQCLGVAPWTHPECLPKTMTEWEVTDWDARKGWSVELAASPVVRSVLGVGPEGSFAGAEFRFGFRRTDRYSSHSIIGDGSEGLRWCMPLVACALVGLFAPTSSWVSNDYGLDLVAGLGRQFDAGGETLAGSIAFRPILRVAAENRFRSQSWIGSLLPEVGLRFADSREAEVFFGWSIYPVDLRLGRNLALGWDGPVIAPSFPLDGAPMRLWVGTGLSLTVLAGEP